MSLWNEPGVPHLGWANVDVLDVEDELESCEMCGRTIRYVHVMTHPEYKDEVRAGSECAKKMAVDYTIPLEREKELRSRAQRRDNWSARNWQPSGNGNWRLKDNGVYITVFPDKFRPGRFKYSIGGGSGVRYSTKSYASIGEAQMAAFDDRNPK